MTLHLADTGPVTPPADAPRCDRCRHWRGLSEILDPVTGKRVLLGECGRANDARSAGVRWQDDHCGQFSTRGVVS